MNPLILACLAATWFIWGSTYLAIKFALHGFPPFFQMGTRFLAAGSLVLAWLVIKRAPFPTPVQWRNALIIGALMLGGGMGVTAFAEQTVASGLVVAFIAVSPAMIALWNALLGVRPKTLEVIGILVGLPGVLLLVSGTGFSGSPHGLLAIVISVTCWSAGSVLSLRVLPLAPGAMGFASEMLCGGVVLMLVSVVSGEIVKFPVPSEAWWAWGYLVVFGSLIGFNAYMTLLARTSAVLASSYAFVNPVIAMMLGIWIGHETVSMREWIATLIIILGVVLIIAGKQVRVLRR